MAERKFQRGGLDQGIAEYVGLKGAYSARVEDVLRPTIQVADLANSPYVADSYPIARATSIATLAANYPYMVITPGEGLTLQVETVRVLSNSGTIRVWLAMMSRFQVALLLTAGVLNSQPPSFGRKLGVQPDLDAVHVRSSYIDSIHSTLLDTTTAIDVADLTGGSHVNFNLPAPGVILTDDRAGPDPGGLAVLSSTLAASIYVSFAGREWPLPG